MNYEGALQRLVASVADAGAARDVRVLAALASGAIRLASGKSLAINLSIFGPL